VAAWTSCGDSPLAKFLKFSEPIFSSMIVSKNSGAQSCRTESAEVSSAQNRAHFEAYARGVNAYVASHRDRLPIRVSHTALFSASWAPEDSTLIAAPDGKDLNSLSVS